VLLGLALLSALWCAAMMMPTRTANSAPAHFYRWPDRSTCYKFEMSETTERWLLFRYIQGEFTPLSKPYKTKQQAEKARLKYPEKERKTIGVGVIRRAN